MKLYQEAGIRSVEIGSVAFGRRLPDGTKETAPIELVRLAITRRVYTRNHLAYVAEAVTYVAERSHTISGMRITYQPAAMRHLRRVSPGCDQTKRTAQVWLRLIAPIGNS